jgi:hypothetical protein
MYKLILKVDEIPSLKANGSAQCCPALIQMFDSASFSAISSE